MRLLELEVQNIRGLRSLNLKPNGQNLVIWGPNGVGKSGVVDAIEFVLTGNIRRLAGEGTGGITLRRYGPHIDHDSESAVVKAVVKIDGWTDPITIQRSIGHPGELECPEDVKPLLGIIGEQVSRGQTVLTRRDILTYISATPGDRATQIQHLLNLDEITAVRAALVTARNRSRDYLRAATRAVNSQKAEVNTTLGWKTFDEDELIRVVNVSRATVGGEPLTSIDSSQLTVGLLRPSISNDNPALNLELVRRASNTLKEVISTESWAIIAEADNALRNIATDLKLLPDINAELEKVELIGQGLRLVGDATEECPLCGALWSPGHLRQHLEERDLSAKAIQQKQEAMGKSAEVMIQQVNQVLSSLSVLLNPKVVSALGSSTKDQVTELAQWGGRLKTLMSHLEHPLNFYPDTAWGNEEIQRLLSPENLHAILTKLENVAENAAPEATPEQTAWETLIRLTESLRALENRSVEEQLARGLRERAEALVTEYEAARDSVLNGLYDRISKSFALMYRKLHAHEGDEFSARMELDGAALTLEVDFYDRGAHPPNALHSEGHQDSMGICLFLALGRELSQVPIDLVILDDVVMSVDASHRKDVCSLFRELFPDLQFIITTHDRTWANQLKQSGVVEHNNLVEFTNWTIQSGPQVRHQMPDMWKSIDMDLKQEDVKTAAFKLRNGSEAFFESVCDAIAAELPYNSAHQWQLDHYLHGAMDTYKVLLRSARSAARSWADGTTIQEFDEKESIRRQIYTRTYAEQWNINAAVHYNNWENLISHEFSEVVDAFRDLHYLFLCTKCTGLLRVFSTGKSLEMVKCPCGTVTWNLKPKTN